MAKFTYDVVIIGSGASGTTVAFEAQAAGLKVAIVEERSWGGTCVLRGCDPKKFSSEQEKQEIFLPDFVAKVLSKQRQLAGQI